MLNNMNYTDYNYQNMQRKLEVQKVEDRVRNLRLAEQTRLLK